jgi:hypothetical protein
MITYANADFDEYECGADVTRVTRIWMWIGGFLNLKRISDNKIIDTYLIASRVYNDI